MSFGGRVGYGPTTSARVLPLELLADVSTRPDFSSLNRCQAFWDESQLPPADRRAGHHAF